MLLKNQLIRKGFQQIEEVNSGEGAIKISREKKIDFIIMDVKLKGEINGIKAMENINARQAILFIIVSAYQDIDQKSLKEVPGYSGFFQKPLTEQGLDQIKIIMNHGPLDRK
jgi:DNA-binding NtrC family response regulator